MISDEALSTIKKYGLDDALNLTREALAKAMTDKEIIEERIKYKTGNKYLLEKYLVIADRSVRQGSKLYRELRDIYAKAGLL